MGEETKKALVQGGTKVAAKGLGALVTVAGYPVEGAMIDGMGELSPLLTGGRVGEWYGQARAWLVSKTARRVEERAEELGITPDPDVVSELFHQAAPALGNASETKRRLMENVLLRGVVEGGGELVQAEAAEAIATIEKMPDFAAIVFAAVVRELDPHQNPRGSRRAYPMPDCGLPPNLFHDAEVYLQGPDASQVPFHTSAGRLVKVRSMEEYELTDRGHWLGRWLLDNPLPPAKEEAEAPPAG